MRLAIMTGLALLAPFAHPVLAQDAPRAIPVASASASPANGTPAVSGTASPVPSVSGSATGSPSPAPSPNPKIDVNVVGAVKNAGRFNLMREAGVVGALSAAGWFAEAGDQKKVKVLRKTQGGAKPQVIFVNIPQILSGEQPDIVLEPEDTIYISQRMVNF